MSATSANDLNEDPVESMLKKTGCISLHYKVQECIAETQDWRKCQDIVKAFKGCMQSKMIKLVQSAFSTKMVLIVRTDLKMGKGKIASQCSHAAILCYQKSLQQKSNLLKMWLMHGQPKIVLKVDSLSEIEDLQKQAQELDIVAEVVRDAGRTQVPESTITVLGLGPHGNELDLLVKPLKLL